MKKYEVTVQWTKTATFEVEAPDETRANQIAYRIGEDMGDDEADYLDGSLDVVNVEEVKNA